MNKIACEACGSSDLVKQDDFFICQFCGVKYTQADIKTMLGTVRIDNTDKLNNLYQLARRAKDENNSENATKYYGMILIEDPTSWEASFYQIYFNALQSRIAQIESTAIAVENSIISVLNLISKNIDIIEKQEEAVQEVSMRCELIANLLYDTANSHYLNIDLSVRLNYLQENINRCLAARDIMYTLGNSIDLLFTDSEKLHKSAVSAWKCGIRMHSRFMKNFDDKETNRNIISSYVEKVKKYEPSFEEQTNTDGGCYVATCVYGSYDCPQVWTLRRYRDFTLTKNWYGRVFIRFYYAVSPKLVKLFGKRILFRYICKIKLDQMILKLNARGVDNSPYIDMIENK